MEGKNLHHKHNLGTDLYGHCTQCSNFSILLCYHDHESTYDYILWPAHLGLLCSPKGWATLSLHEICKRGCVRLKNSQFCDQPLFWLHSLLKSLLRKKKLIFYCWFIFFCNFPTCWEEKLQKPKSYSLDDSQPSKVLFLIFYVLEYCFRHWILPQNFTERFCPKFHTITDSFPKFESYLPLCNITLCCFGESFMVQNWSNAMI